MAVNPLALLTSVLSRTGLTSTTPTATGTGSPAPTDDLATLFQSVLTTAVNQAAAVATPFPVSLSITPASPPATPATNPSDLLNSLLGQLDQAAQGTDSQDDPKAVNADALSQLLAALGVNVQQAAAPPTTPTPPTAQPTSPAITARENTNPLTTPTNPLLALTTAATPNTPPLPGTVAPTTVSQPADQLAATPALPSQTVSVADANRVAGRNPAVVAQVPIVTDLNQGLPNAVDPTGRAVAPPVNEPTAVKGVPPVNPGVNPAVAQDALPANGLDIGTAPVTGPLQTVTARPTVADTGTPLPTPPFAVQRSPNEPPVVVPTDTHAPTLSTTAPTQPGVASTDQPSVPTVTATAVPAVPQSAPTAPPVAATPTRPANPDIAVTVAQPVAVPVGQLDVLKFGGMSIGGGTPIPSDQPTRAETGTPLPFAPVPAGGNAPVAPPTVETPAAVAPSPVAEQLAGPITAQVSDRHAGGETEIQVRLDPPELGAVKLKIVSTGGEVRAELHVSSEAVRQVVQSQLPDLQQRLDDAGVRVQRFDVTADPQGGTARDDRGERWRGPPPVDLPPSPVRPRSAAVLAAATGLLDVNA